MIVGFIMNITDSINEEWERELVAGMGGYLMQPWRVADELGQTGDDVVTYGMIRAALCNYRCFHKREFDISVISYFEFRIQLRFAKNPRRFRFADACGKMTGITSFFRCAAMVRASRISSFCQGPSLLLPTAMLTLLEAASE